MTVRCQDQIAFGVAPVLGLIDEHVIPLETLGVFHL